MEDSKESVDKAPEEKGKGLEANPEEAENASEEAVSHPDKPQESGQGDREMFKATCAECKQDCEVPFKPEEGRDVFCKECYQKKKPKRSFDRGGRGGFSRGRGFDRGREQRQMHKAVCAECKKDCEVPFKPNGQKPVLCKDCFMKNK